MPCISGSGFRRSSILGSARHLASFGIATVGAILYGSDYSPRSRANSYKAGNDDVFSLFHAETD